MATNDQLAHLQAATVERFSKGLGFQMTVLGRDRPSNFPYAITYWMHPSIPMRFVYEDNVNDYGDVVGPVQVDRATVDTYLAQMDSPRGLVLSHADETWMPFKPPQGSGG